MKPNFLFIGADKSGSTWLDEVLREHPECYVPPCKDIYFFDRYYDRGLEWYLSFFRHAPPSARAVGELSHDYLYSPQAAKRIARDLPEVKLIACFRDPVERTFSEYIHMMRSGLTRKSFAEALEEFPEMVEHSRYAVHLSEYLRLFDRSQIKVVMFDQLQADPAAFAREVFEFLGVRFVPELQYDRRVLPAGKPRLYALARLAKLSANAARTLGLVNLVGRVKRSQAVAALLFRPYASDERPRIEPAIRARLEDLFRPDVKALQDVLGVSLAHWLPRSDGSRR